MHVDLRVMGHPAASGHCASCAVERPTRSFLVQSHSASSFGSLCFEAEPFSTARQPRSDIVACLLRASRSGSSVRVVAAVVAGLALACAIAANLGPRNEAGLLQAGAGYTLVLLPQFCLFVIMAFAPLGAGNQARWQWRKRSWSTQTRWREASIAPLSRNQRLLP